MDLSIIILNYKSPDKTNRCIKSIKDSDTSGLKLEIIVVDNYSQDDGDALIRRANNDVMVIESGRNLGMGGGNNLGIASARGKHILILNADTIIKGKAIRVLYDFIEGNKDAGIVGPKLFNADGSLQYSCMRFPKIYTPILRRTILGKIFKKHVDSFLMKDFDHEEIRQVDWLMGSCLMLKRELIDKLCKVFDDGFFMYFEDIDLCHRAHEAGFKIYYDPEAQVVHDHGRGSAGKPWYLAPFTNKLAREHIKSWIRYFLKNSINHGKKHDCD